MSIHMELQLLWFVLAGFILGFIVSTLWEWLHFRQKFAEQRDRRIAELEASLTELQSSNQEASYNFVYPEDILPAVNEQPEHRSSGVLLETEQAQGMSQGISQGQYSGQY